MENYFKYYLFNHNILVSEETQKSTNAFESVYAISKLFNIRIVSGQELADEKMISFISERLGKDVPEPFYKGFPESVRALSKDQLLFDQMVHYFHTYGMGDFSETGHSVIEDYIGRTAFNEEAEIIDFQVLSEDEAVQKLAGYADNLLKGTRPVNEDQFFFLCEYIKTYDYDVCQCASKNLAIKLLLTFRNVKYADFIRMSDVIKLVDEMNYAEYGNENLRKLNLKNRDRKFITGVINQLFHAGRCDIRTCYEKKAVWNGLLHHIHYCPIDAISLQFTQSMRGKENLSVYSEFEKAMAARDIKEAVETLKNGKGNTAVLRNLNYILSRCETPEDIRFVADHMESSNGIVLLQLLMQYAAYKNAYGRVFKFTRHNKLKVHTETDEEAAKRKSVITTGMAKLLTDRIKDNLEKIYANKLGTVYIDPAMKNIALPIQETTSSGGFGILPKGSRLPIPETKKIRAFTYWEKVNDIDLSVIGLRGDGSQTEFSWRTMAVRQSGAITYSGDETSGYKGGSEYFDVDIQKFKKKYPDVKYLIFCDNVYSGLNFNQCVCKAGYMSRDVEDSGEVFEPKTVKTSFTINCDSRFAYLFAIDLAANDFIWLNISRDSNVNVAGTTAMDFLTAYFDVTSVMNLYDFFFLLATEVTEDSSKADVVVSDEPVDVLDEAEVIHSTDIERITALMNS